MPNIEIGKGINHLTERLVKKPVENSIKWFSGLRWYTKLLVIGGLSFALLMAVGGVQYALTPGAGISLL